jgi:hypothetical protein
MDLGRGVLDFLHRGSGAQKHGAAESLVPPLQVWLSLHLWKPTRQRIEVLERWIAIEFGGHGAGDGQGFLGGAVRTILLFRWGNKRYAQRTVRTMRTVKSLLFYSSPRRRQDDADD